MCALSWDASRVLCRWIFRRPRCDGQAVSGMATFRLKDAGAAGRKSGGVRMQSMHTIDPIACSDSVRRTDAHVRPSTRWETEDVGGSSWAPLRSPNRSPRLSIHRPASVREDLRPLATGGHVPRLSPRMRRLYRYTMCTRSPKPRASPCRSCCLWRLEVSFSDDTFGARDSTLRHR
jgi:hypothetical protein